MTQDEIIRMALEAGYQSVYLSDAPIGRSYQFLERFAALVAAHEREKHLNLANEVAWSVALAEREACAKVCEEMWAGGYGPFTITAAIRARGEK